LDDIKNGWMTIATSLKSNVRITPIFKRYMLGQKGIGRFAVENLSKKTTILSFPRNENIGFRISFDWEKYAPNSDLSSVKNKIEKFEKTKDKHGVIIYLQDLQHKWSQYDIQRLWMFIRSLTPPAEIAANFAVKIYTDEFEDLSGKTESAFLEKALYKFQATLTRTGQITYQFYKHGKTSPINGKIARLDDFSCGPIDFTLYFYYREKTKMRSNGIIIDDFETYKKILDNYGGIKVYRDGIRLSGFGNPEDDWTGLDGMSRNDPSVVPARNQIISVVKITSEFNPEITDTTTRENIIKNQSFQSMLKYVQDAISVFAQMRGELEEKRTSGPREGNKYVRQAREAIQKNKSRGPLIDFTDDYPLIFYHSIEEEINQCYYASLPNASLVLSRKLVENLLMNILEEKFSREVELRYDADHGRAQDFSVLIQNLERKISEFNGEQKELIGRLLQWIKPFRREANSTTHKIMDYLDTIDDLEKLKIAEIVQIELDLLKKIKAVK